MTIPDHSMTTRAYKYISNFCFGVATLSVLFFDSFNNHLLPGLALLGAGLTAAGVHIFARFNPLEHDDPAEAPVPANKAGSRVSTPRY